MSRSIRVLLVEDNLINQKVVTHIIDKLPETTVEAVSSGEEALTRLRSEQFDLVLMDVQLEGMSGLETIQSIRASEASATSSTVPVAVLSGYSDEEQERKAKDAGADRYLLKPVDIEELKELLEEIRSPSV
ncbi:MAG: response regulator [Alkalispirochaetaceae bacterium]